jgi:hypothetical protein
MNAFVQINLEFHEARQRGDISGGAYSLGLYLACEANYFTKRTLTTLPRIADDLEWECSMETVRRRLTELREHGFIAYDVKRGSPRGYPIQVTEKLLYNRDLHKTSTDLHTEDPFRVEVSSSPTSTEAPVESREKSDGETLSPASQPPHRPPQEGGVQERLEKRPLPSGKTVRARAVASEMRRGSKETLLQAPPRGSQSRPVEFVANGNGSTPEDLDENFIAELEGSGSEFGKMLASTARRARSGA